MALYLTLALVIIFLILFPFPTFRRFGERHPIPTNFLLTILATFLGVFLSMRASEVQSQDQSKEDSILLLNSLTQDARSKIAIVQNSNLFTDDTKARPDEFIKQFYPSPVREVILNDTSLRNYSPDFIVNISSYAAFLESYMNEYRRNELMSTRDFRDVYVNTSRKLVVLMELEKFYLNGDIDREAHDLLYRCYFDMGRGFQKEKIPSDLECKNELLGMKKRIPQEFWQLKELDK